MPLNQTLPICPHFGQCGGCLRQGISYSEELQLKEEKIQTLFRHYGAPILPIVPSPSLLHFRNKMEFNFSERGGTKIVGLSQRGKEGYLVSIKECLLVPPSFMELLESIRQWWHQRPMRAYFGRINRGTLRTLTLRQGIRTGERMAILTVSGDPEFRLLPHDQLSLVAALEERVHCDSIVIREQITARGKPTNFCEIALTGKGFISECLEGEKRIYHFKIRPSSFFQPNPLFAERFFKEIVSRFLESGEFLVDLYCGGATFGIFASSYCNRLMGIELNEEAISDAQDNLLKNQIDMELIQGDVGRVLDATLRPTTIVVDPPRAGLGQKTIDKLLCIKSKKILYISCNPYSQAEDVQSLVKGGYRVVAILPGDQFPYTDHLENLVALEYGF